MGIATQILFLFLLVAAIGLFSRNVGRLRRNIRLGRPLEIKDRSGERWAYMARVALGQSKMVVRPIAGIMHILVYVGFVLINIELLEIVIDGLFGTHRVFAFMGGFYDFLIGTFEVLAALVIIAVAVFWWRRNPGKLGRFSKPEMKGWPEKDGNTILYIEWVLMFLFLTMNAADYRLQQLGADHYIQAGSFPVSQWIAALLGGWTESSLIALERTAWWLHIAGILFFLNYLYYSKHLHILLAFPNTWFANLEAKGRFSNMESVTREVALMMDPAADPFAAAPANTDSMPERFGAADVFDLNWRQLMNAYTCTECGRCTSECPANQTGKLLSPRKIMMDTRDRLEEVGRVLDANKGEWKDDGKKLLDNHISREELWACTTCNACVEACPVGIDPLSIILEMRRYLVMEESAAPTELNVMMTNIENNGAPWPFNQMDRLQWAEQGRTP